MIVFLVAVTSVTAVKVNKGKPVLVAEIPVLGRAAQGVKVIRIGEGERLAGVERIVALADSEAVESGEAAPAVNLDSEAGEDPSSSSG